jgi:hypothetical protein
MQATVTRYTMVDGEKPFVMYHILCTCGSFRWEVVHRFSDFEKLDKELANKKHRSHGKLPPKILFGNMSQTQIQKRMTALQLYLDVLLGDPTTLEDENIDKFLEIKRHTKVQSNLRRGIIAVNADYVQAIFDHEAKDETELSFKRGDQLIVLHREGTWWYGTRRSDKSHAGFFLSNYVQPFLPMTDVVINRPHPRVIHSYEEAQLIKNRPVGKVMQLAFEYLTDDESTVRRKDRIQIIAPENEEPVVPGCSYVVPEKISTRFWIPDEFLSELAEQ